MSARPQQQDFFGKASTRPCTVCKRHFIGVASESLCPQCEKNSDFYRRSRKKGDPRDFLDYPELLAQWKNRRKECAEWRKAATEAANDRQARERAELDRSFLLAALVALDGAPDLDLAAALGEAQTTARRLEAELESWKQKARDARSEALNLRLESLRQWKADAGSIPAEQWRRLAHLCHPDKHGGSEAATNAMQWLNQVRP